MSPAIFMRGSRLLVPTKEKRGQLKPFSFPGSSQMLSMVYLLLFGAEICSLLLISACLPTTSWADGHDVLSYTSRGLILSVIIPHTNTASLKSSSYNRFYLYHHSDSMFLFLIRFPINMIMRCLCNMVGFRLSLV